VSARLNDLERWQFLAQAGLALDESHSVDELEATVLGLVVPRLADLCVVRLRGDLALELETSASPVHARPELMPFLRRSNASEREVPSSRHPAGRVLATGQAEWGDVDAGHLEAVARDADHLARLRAMGPTSAMVVPVTARGRTLGILALVVTKHSGRRYTRADLALASDFARRVGAALERRAQEELVRRSIRERLALVR
jgi:GAF domain-containing protein